MLLLLLLSACGHEAGDESPFVVVLRDAGAPLAEGADFDFSTPQAAYFAAEHVTPDLDSRWTFPSSNIPLFIWEEVLLPENVADPGICPYLIASGSTTTWQTNCRSQEGYNWSGQVERTVWDEDGLGEWQHYDFELVVDSDEERRVFDRIAMTGELFFLNGNDDPVARFGQTNLVIEATGYWANGFEPEMETAWQHLAISGAWQTLAADSGETHTVSAVVDLGGYGGFTVESDPLAEQTSCIAEPKGDVLMSGIQSAKLHFEGADRCDGCAEFYVDGVRSTNACRSY